MDKFLKLLLEKEDTVILPGLGAIIVEDRKSGHLVFNEFLKYNDGKLDKIIVDNSKMDLQEAQNSVAKYTREIETNLDKGESYAIFGIGALSKDKGGRIRISGTLSGGTKKEDTAKSATASKEKPKTEGKSEKKEAPKKEATQPKKEEKSEKKETPKKEATQPKKEEKSEKKEVKKEEPKKKENKLEESKPKEEPKKEDKAPTKDNKAEKPPKKEKVKPKKEKKEKTGKKKKGVFFWIMILILVVFAGGGIFIGLNYDEVKSYMGWDEFEDVEVPVTTKKDEADQPDEVGEEIQQGELNEPEIIEDGLTVEEGEESAQVEVEEQEEQEEEEIIEEEPVEEEPDPVVEKEPKTPVETQPATSASGDFHLIAGTFTNKSNADKLVENLKSKGYPAENIGFLNNMHYVSVKSFSTAREAQQNASSVQADAPGAWVYKRP